MVGMSYYVPYVPTPIPVVRAMLKVASAGPEDIVYDLGCGDGRILIIAVKEFNVKKAVGIEKDRERIKEARMKIESEEIKDRIVLINDDFFNVEISDATIVTLFLLTSVNEALKPKFERELKEGTRIVSHEFRIPGWKPYKTIDVRDDNGSLHTVFLYIMGKHK